jgi:hypothetical protein
MLVRQGHLRCTHLNTVDFADHTCYTPEFHKDSSAAVEPHPTENGQFRAVTTRMAAFSSVFHGRLPRKPVVHSQSESQMVHQLASCEHEGQRQSI